MLRREFLQTSLAAAITTTLLRTAAAQPQRPRRILLRSAWQTVNIGDIGHTPGVLTLLERHLPDVEVQLWPSSVDSGVDDLLMRRFPKLKILKGTTAINQGMQDCDFLLHGSGASLVATKDVKRWKEETGKPYGIFGITISSLDDTTTDLINHAKFAFFRDSVSLKLVKDHGCTCPIMEFGPDGAFAVDLRNDAAAEAFLRANGLVEKQFLCCIPRLRYTPYWKIKAGRAFDQAKHDRNEEMKEHDHAPLREAIVAVTRQTPLKVLLCPEDSSQMAVGKELIYDKLPDDVKEKVVWRETYWLTDEALSTYVRSVGLFGLEMHSPIMGIGNGVPAIVCRFQEQTSKGFMWRDIGLGDWLFDMDQPGDVARIVPTVLDLAKNPDAAAIKVAKAREVVKQRQERMLAALTHAMEAQG
ncbi:MAG TPA: polysaccharide pyruvyl transferase family protein [Planctomycetaceae bacterium]|nr:polysaccharide pyruvyl transferase family protein [Planctomycetaceae bacterium]